MKDHIQQLEGPEHDRSTTAKTPTDDRDGACLGESRSWGQTSPCHLSLMVICTPYPSWELWRQYPIINSKGLLPLRETMFPAMQSPGFPLQPGAHLASSTLPSLLPHLPDFCLCLDFPFKICSYSHQWWLVTMETTIRWQQPLTYLRPSSSSSICSRMQPLRVWDDVPKSSSNEGPVSPFQNF